MLIALMPLCLLNHIAFLCIVFRYCITNMYEKCKVVDSSKYCTKIICDTFAAIYFREAIHNCLKYEYVECGAWCMSYQPSILITCNRVNQSQGYEIPLNYHVVYEVICV